MNVVSSSFWPMMRNPKKVRTILVVDDDPEILATLPARLEKRGFRVLTAADGNLAIEDARRYQPDLMILDVMMPGKTGWEVARVLANDPGTAPIKIVMLTDIGERMHEMTSPPFGANAHFDKPLDFAALEAKIAELLG